MKQVANGEYIIYSKMMVTTYPRFQGCVFPDLQESVFYHCGIGCSWGSSEVLSLCIGEQGGEEEGPQKALWFPSIRLNCVVFGGRGAGLNRPINCCKYIEQVDETQLRSAVAACDGGRSHLRSGGLACLVPPRQQTQTQRAVGHKRHSWARELQSCGTPK